METPPPCPAPDDVTCVTELEELYGAPGVQSLRKEAARVTPEYRELVEASPFVVLATSGPGGLDCSPRGGEPGFVRVVDPHTLWLPDSSGNNRLDSMHNLLVDPRISLLFLIPGVGETLRVVGTARLTRAPEVLGSFGEPGRPPAVVLVITVESVYFQCPKAIVRSRLWSPERFRDRRTLPSTWAVLAGVQRSGASVAEDAPVAQDAKAAR